MKTFIRIYACTWAVLGGYAAITLAAKGYPAMACRDMSDRQVNHVTDWMFYLAGRRQRPPAHFGRMDPHGTSKGNLVALCCAISRIVPPGFTVNPVASSSWQIRQCGRWATSFEAFDVDELRKLIEGVKAIFRRLGDRGTATRSDQPLADGGGEDTRGAG